MRTTRTRTRTTIQSLPDVTTWKAVALIWLVGALVIGAVLLFGMLEGR